MNIPPYEPDMLDDVAAYRAQTEPEAARGWAAIKLVSQLCAIREAQGLSRADVAARMNVAPAAVARLEGRPWGAGLTRILAYAQALGVEVGIVGELPHAA